MLPETLAVLQKPGRTHLLQKVSTHFSPVALRLSSNWKARPDARASLARSLVGHLNGLAATSRQGDSFGHRSGAVREQ
jgi:hypothetical protein